MIQVANSSSVIAYDYDKQRQTLIVEYNKTGLYEYYDVTPSEFNILSLNTSVGKAIKDLIKGKAYKKI